MKSYIWRDSKNNLKELALEALDCLHEYHYDVNKFLDRNDFNALIKAKVNRRALDVKIWDMRVISHYVDKLIATKEKAHHYHSNQQQALIRNHQTNPHFVETKRLLKQIIKHVDHKIKKNH